MRAQVTQAAAPVLVALIGLAVAAAALGCHGHGSVTCLDGTVCPQARVCAPVGTGYQCVDPDQIAACEGLADGAICELGSAGEGACRSGLCVVYGCGDGIVDLGEVCDDGNSDSGDGCRADCQKVEVCGDAVVDDGEACDDGNDNASDGCDRCVATRWVASSVLGGSRPPSSHDLSNSKGLAVDGQGNVFFAVYEESIVVRLDAETGLTTIIAGTGTPGYSGDGGPATSAGLTRPEGLDVDGLGNLFIADSGSDRIRRVDALTGFISTVAGAGNGEFSGDGGPATAAYLNSPSSVTVDGLGNLFIADNGNHRVRRVSKATGLISTVAGTDTFGFSGDGELATSAELKSPKDVVVDGQGNLYIADQTNARIRRVDSVSGTISTIAGNGNRASTGDGGPSALAELDLVRGLHLDSVGNLFIAEANSNRVRVIDATSNQISTVVGGGDPADGVGDGGPPLGAQLADPAAIAMDADGSLLILDANHNRVRRVDRLTTTIDTVAGPGTLFPYVDGTLATGASLYFVSGVATDSDGVLFVVERRDASVHRIDLTSGTITAFAGVREIGLSGDGGPAIEAALNFPTAVAVTESDVFILDQGNQRIRRVDRASGVITTAAGGGGFLPADGLLATDAFLLRPEGLAADAQGNLFVAAGFYGAVYRIDGTMGTMTAIAGLGTPADGLGDDGQAIDASFDVVVALAVDGDGNLFVADGGAQRIRRIDGQSKVITTFAGGGAEVGDGVLATDALLSKVVGVATDPAGHVLIADDHRVRRVDAVTGIITTVAGTGETYLGGDGLLATEASCSDLEGITTDGSGNIFLSSAGSVRRVSQDTGIITTVAGQVAPPNMGPLALSQLADPRSFVLTTDGAFFAAGTSGVVQSIRYDQGRLDAVAGRYQHVHATANLARFRAADFGTVAGVAVDSVAGVLYLTELEGHRVIAVTLAAPADPNGWTLETLAGDGTAGFADGPGLSAQFRDPTELLLDESRGILYVADTGNHIIRAIDVSGGVSSATVSTVAGTPQTRGYFGDGELAQDALLFRPRGLTKCGNGDFFFSDTGNHRVRRIAAGTGLLSTVLGDGVATSSGQGTPALEFPVNQPLGLACDATGNLFVTSTSTVRLLPADSAGVVDGTGAVQTIFGGPPRDTFLESVSRCLTDVAVVDSETLWLTDSCTGLLLELRRQPL